MFLRHTHAPRTAKITPTGRWWKGAHCRTAGAEDALLSRRVEQFGASTLVESIEVFNEQDVDGGERGAILEDEEELG